MMTRKNKPQWEDTLLGEAMLRDREEQARLDRQKEESEDAEQPRKDLDNDD